MLQEDKLCTATTFLGKPYHICGRVVRGQGRGQKWNIPTANISLHRHKLAIGGVFYVQVTRENGEILHGVANLGTRPTLDGSKKILEIHLFQFHDNLYGEYLQTHFLHKLRNEVKFSTLEALITQIRYDIQLAKSKALEFGFRDYDDRV